MPVDALTSFLTHGTVNPTLPTEAQVEEGVGFGVDGTQYTGLLGAPTPVSVEEIYIDLEEAP